jgi:tocopherol O-methyltransferase
MIEPRTAQRPPAVAAHYDDLDRLYRDVWGEHVHHGLWDTGRESSTEAVENLVVRVAELAEIGRGDEVCDVCDVGCGYGATARMLASRYGARVTGLSLSDAQLRFAREHTVGDNPRYLLRDWLENDLPDASFDAVIAVESSEHVGDKERFFSEAHRVLRPGGRLVVCAWLSSDAPRPWEIDHLLEPICREGRLTALGTAGENRGWIERAGFVVEEHRDVSRQVKRTWPLCIGRTLRLLAREPATLGWLIRGESENRIFALTMLRLWLAYEVGAMRYGIFKARRA